MLNEDAPDANCTILNSSTSVTSSNNNQNMPPVRQKREWWEKRPAKGHLRTEPIPTLFAHDINLDNRRHLLKDSMQDLTSHLIHSTGLPKQGRAIFWCQSLKGATRPLVTVFDSGCSTVVMKNDIPGSQLMATKLPSDITKLRGIGGTQETTEKYAILLPKMNGGYKITEGHTVKNMIELQNYAITGALNQIKQDAQSNDEVQKAQVHQRIGGKIDLLIGICCIDIFPTLVHETGEGLGLYKLKLASHNPRYKYCLGGKYIQTSSVEKFPSNLLSLAVTMENLQETLEKIFTNHLPEITEQIEPKEGESTSSEICNMTNTEADDQGSRKEQITIGLAKPPHDLIEGNSDDNVNIITKNTSTKELLLKVLEGDLEANYRCERCISCLTCKQGESKQMMSVAQSIEEKLLRDSITFNKETKRFTARLPIQGEVAAHLAPNKNMIEKSIRDQVKRISDDPIGTEAIRTSFNKLVQKGFISKLQDLPIDTQNQIKMQKVNYYIPWVLAYKPGSRSTPVRVCFDASRKTPSGKSLNDILPKGCSDLSLERMAVNFSLNRIALVADISKFYNSFDLDKRDWYLQLILWQDDLDPSGPLSTYVIKTLIYGVKSVARHTELAMELLSKEYKETNPELYRLLTNCRYVDDLSSSVSNTTEAQKLKNEADELLHSVGMITKGWTMSGQEPNEDLAVDGKLAVGGYNWDSKKDTISIRVPPIHYSKKRKGKISDELFEGKTKAELDAFTPKHITFRQVTSRYASIFDIRGIISPLLSDLKLLLRESGTTASRAWEFTLPADLRNRWVSALWTIEKLKTLEYPRCSIPPEALSLKGHLSTFADSSGIPKSQEIAYISFPLKNGKWSKQFMLAKNQIAPIASHSIPNMELHALTLGAHLGNKISTWLGDFVHTRSLATDSEVALHWIRNENKKQAPFQRNRVRDIKRFYKDTEIYHISGKNNPADIGTRTGITIQDICPTSKFYLGPEFLTLGLEGMVKNNILRPIHDLVLKTEVKEGYQDNLMRRFEDPTDHFIGIADLRMRSRLMERYEYTQYLIDPLKYKWSKLVKIMMLIFTFLRKLLLKLERKELSFKYTQMYNNLFISFNSKLVPLELLIPSDTILHANTEERRETNPPATQQLINSITSNIREHQQTALAVGMYFLKRASNETKNFCPRSVLKRHAIEKDGILVSRNRWRETCTIKDTLEIDVEIPNFGIRSNAPYIDRNCPVAIALAQHVHTHVTPHRGSEFCQLASLNFIEIYQGQRLFEKVVRDCITCKKRLKRRMHATFGHLHPTQLSIGCVMAIAQLDMSGPWTPRTHLRAKGTRGRPSNTKVYVVHAVCTMSHLSQSLIVEDYTSESFLSAITRLSCNYGVPRKILIDPSSTEICGLINAKVTLKDPLGKITTESGIQVEVCAVGAKAHARHGLVEKRIGMIKEALQTHWGDINALSILTFQGVLEQVDNLLNSTPLGYSQCYGRSPTSRLITPNHFRLGRSNNRTPAEAIQIPETRGSMLRSATEVSQALTRYIIIKAIPQLLIRPKWIKETPDKLKEGDLVLFQKRSGPLSSQWKMGRISGKESDHIVELSYGNASELLLPLNKTDELTPTLTTHHTRRDTRSLVKLYSLDDPSINKDIAYLNNWHRMKMKERDLNQNTNLEDLCEPSPTGSNNVPPQNQKAVMGEDLEPSPTGSNNVPPQSPPKKYHTRSKTKVQNTKR